MSVVENVSQAEIERDMAHPTDESNDQESLLKLRDLRAQTQLKLNELKGSQYRLTGEQERLVGTMESNLKAIDESIASIEGKAAQMLLEAAKAALANIAPKESVNVISIKEEKKMSDEKVKEAFNAVGKADAKFVSDSKQVIPQKSAPPATTGDSDKPSGMSAESAAKEEEEKGKAKPVKDEEEEKMKPVKSEEEEKAKPVKSEEEEKKAPVKAEEEGTKPKPKEEEAMADTKDKLIEKPKKEEEAADGGVKASPPVKAPVKDEEALPATSNVKPITTSDTSKREEEATNAQNTQPQIKNQPVGSGQPPAPAPKDVPVSMPGGSPPAREEEEKTRVKAQPEKDEETGVPVAKEEYDPSLTVSGRMTSPFSSIRKVHREITQLEPKTRMPEIGQRSVIKVPGRYSEALAPAQTDEPLLSHDNIAARAREIVERMGARDKTEIKALNFRAMKEILDKYVGHIET
jgi:hypothetical protein